MHTYIHIHIHLYIHVHTHTHIHIRIFVKSDIPKNLYICNAMITFIH